MTTINAVNNTLTGATGTGSFVGSISPTLTGTIDASGATSFEVPNSAAPTTSSAGQIALDTTITGYTPLPQFNDGTNTLYAISIPTADLSTTNNNIVTYNSASSKFTLTAPSGGADKVVGFASASATSTTSVTVVTYVDTSLTITYTPTNASNLLFIQVYCQLESNKNTGNNTERYGYARIRRTSGSAATLTTSKAGRLLSSSSSSTSSNHDSVCMAAIETAGSTSAHTYVAQIAGAGSAGVTFFRSDSASDQTYSESLDIAMIPIRYGDGFSCPTNEAFHEAALALQKKIALDELIAKKEISYPSINDRLSAIEKQLKALCQKSLISFEPDFMKTLSDIEKVDTFYDTQS